MMLGDYINNKTMADKIDIGFVFNGGN